MAMPSDIRTPRALGLLALFLVVVLGVGSIIGALTAPGDWYASLVKPPFNPPGWVFGPVWFVLYVLIAIAGWRALLTGANTPAMWLWAAQMMLNWLWSPVWFSLHSLWPAFVIIAMLLLVILAFIGSMWTRDRLAAWLFVPYAAWVAFASVLNLTIAILNS